MKTLSSLHREAFETKATGFYRLIQEVRELMTFKEKDFLRVKITGRLTEVPAIDSGQAIVVGDLHGDLESLIRILTESQFIECASNDIDNYLVFLGDYGDRGSRSVEVIYLILKLKTMFPENVILLQGNHEAPKDIMACPHDLPYQVEDKFGSNGRMIYKELISLFQRFQTAVLFDGICVMVHGGVPSKARTFYDLAYAYEKHPTESHLEEILWSDPSKGFKGIRESPRGAGKLFGEVVTDNFLKLLNVNFLVRGHQPTREGYKLDHNNKILTLFSRKGSPYFNKWGAFLILDLAEKFDQANQLEPFIVKF